MNITNIELEYLYHLVGNTSFDEFSGNFSKFMSKNKLDEFRKQGVHISTYDKICEELGDKLSCM